MTRTNGNWSARAAFQRNRKVRPTRSGAPCFIGVCEGVFRSRPEIGIKTHVSGQTHFWVRWVRPVATLSALCQGRLLGLGQRLRRRLNRQRPDGQIIGPDDRSADSEVFGLSFGARNGNLGLPGPRKPLVSLAAGRVRGKERFAGRSVACTGVSDRCAQMLVYRESTPPLRFRRFRRIANA